MSVASTIAVSGMNVAALRMQVSARDVANSLSDNFVPQQIVQTDTLQNTAGTVQSAAFPTDPYGVLTNAMVQELVARFNLVADAHVFRADVQMQANLLYLFA